LLDVNVLLALVDTDHQHHGLVQQWIGKACLDWGVCAFTEAGFLRIAINPKVGFHRIEQANAVLADLATRPGYRYWPMESSWTTLTAPFSTRIFGHQQINDALLLGLAAKEKGVLVTLDKGIRYLAEPGLLEHLLVLP
jgi:toxin-antitoxin system PIN domain toxin